MHRLAVPLVCLLAVAACSGTTEARENTELQPGSGDLGAGDVPTAPDDVDPGAGPLDDVDDPALATTTPPVPGAPCGSAEARREISAVPRTLLLSDATAGERRAVVQLGDMPEVGERLATELRRARAAGEPDVDAVEVTSVVCADETAAALAFRVWRGATSAHRTGTVMLIDGTWRFTLDALCRLLEHAPCTEVAGLDDQAAKLLSPSLRPRAEGT